MKAALHLLAAIAPGRRSRRRRRGDEEEGWRTGRWATPTPALLATPPAAERLAELLPNDAAATAFFADLAALCRETIEEERIADEEFPHRLR